MTSVSQRFFRSLSQALLLALLLVGASACVTHETRPAPIINARKATAPIPDAELLDVSVQLFDANIPQNEKQREKADIYPEVRKAEARFIPMKLRDTLERTGQWGQVRVVPEGAQSVDVLVKGKILESTGMRMQLDIDVTDATGRAWLHKVYEGMADTRAYKDTTGKARDPFQNVYSTIANDMLQLRQNLMAADREAIHRVADLRFASELAPYAFKDYLHADKNGQFQVVRLPAQDDAIYERMERLRDRDYALVDTLNEHYSVFAGNMNDSYNSWRKYSYSEIEAEEETKRSALNRKLLGAAAIVGGLIAGTQSNTYVGEVAGTAAVFGGIYAMKSGFDKGAEVKMHRDSLKQLSESFQAEVQPMVVDVEGRTLQLKGSAEEQYQQWRGLLKQLYENETGSPVHEPHPVAQTRAEARPE